MTVAGFPHVGGSSGARALTGIGPSCLGGAHRRCLLEADRCTCDCHRDETPVSRAPARKFRCWDCAETFTTEVDRSRHWIDTHHTYDDEDLTPPSGRGGPLGVRAPRSAESGKAPDRTAPVP